MIKPITMVVNDPISIDSSIRINDTVEKNIPAENEARSPFNLWGYLMFIDKIEPKIKEDAIKSVIIKLHEDSSSKIETS
ncbi:MAG: hypothetical protein L0H53_10355 [Candidatus Nitrosocosmicus sp.]|nr:hypothetical protein [Candidatus Nitrosocosmicus sp.]